MGAKEGRLLTRHRWSLPPWFLRLQLRQTLQRLQLRRYQRLQRRQLQSDR